MPAARLESTRNLGVDRSSIHQQFVNKRAPCWASCMNEIRVMTAAQRDLGSRVGHRDQRAASSVALFPVGQVHERRAAHSPARAVQERLSETLTVSASSDRWSGRNTLLFVVATCGGFWLAVGLALIAFRR
jgi:hypothetical protein